ncbi:hypothetical protein [Desulfurivibrio dismutans]|uniref:hypothetical protein n=1 Tax=Desulfurivibrio dismutans TaxID=1398908 RepID=UPI0023DA9C46|nr:hypothetical protein [Desulfurivibrio alkaliphilus]MDF1614344.1 hypothetical protein [Desulfurivibrio alkaliphilus]
MTTIIAMFSGYVFYSNGIWWALVTVIISGVLQEISKRSMGNQYKFALENGYSHEQATEAISDKLTQINMVLTIIILIHGAYSLIEVMR